MRGACTKTRPEPKDPAERGGAQPETAAIQQTRAKKYEFSFILFFAASGPRRYAKHRQHIQAEKYEFLLILFRRASAPGPAAPWARKNAPPVRDSVWKMAIFAGGRFAFEWLLMAPQGPLRSPQEQMTIFAGDQSHSRSAQDPDGGLHWNSLP